MKGSPGQKMQGVRQRFEAERSMAYSWQRVGVPHLKGQIVLEEMEMMM